MKSPSRLCFVSSILLALGTVSQGQTIEWQSPFDSSFADSYGNVLDNSFVFQLGAFTDSFVPLEENVGDWLSFWQVFDQANYNPNTGAFGSVANMIEGGLSDSPFMTSGASSFEGLNAYLWIRNSDDPIPGSEWLLVRATDWVFPDFDPDCCAGPPIEWALSDLTSTDVPNWGSQSGVEGPGERTNTDVYDLQTHTFIPEPSSLLLVFLGSGLLMRRRRPA